MLVGRSRTETTRWLAFRSHYGFEAFYCQPGVEGAHEKGGVEGEGGRFRRNHLVPVPKVASMAELNALLTATTPPRTPAGSATARSSVGQHFAVEAGPAAAAADRAVRHRAGLTPRVDRYARISVGSASTRCRPG